MSLIDSAFARLGYHKDLSGWENIVQSGPEWWRQLWQPMPRYSIEDMVQQYKNWVYACVTARADAVAKLEQKLYAQRGKEDPVEVDMHPWINVMRQPNPITSRYDLWFNTIMFQDLTGVSPWLIIPNSLGVPEQIWNLLPQNLKMDRDSENRLKWVYWNNGKKMTIPSELLVLHKYPSPVSLIWGYSPIEAVGDPINIDHASDTYEWNKLDNGMVPPFVFTQPEEGGHSTQSEEIKAFTEQWKKTYSKVMKGHLPGVLPPGWGTDIIQATVDASRPELAKMSMQKILAGYRTSLAVLGLTEDVNKASAQAVINFWLKNTIMPLTMRIEETIENQILNNPAFYPAAKRQGVWLDLDFEYPDMTDKEFELKTFEATKKAQTVNEWRDFAGLEDIGKEGEVILVPIGEIPLSAAGIVPGQVPGQQEPPKMLSEAPEKGVVKLSRHSQWQLFARKSEAWERKLITVLDAFFAAQKREVLRRLDETFPRVEGAISGMAIDRTREWLAKTNAYEQVIFDFEKSTLLFDEMVAPVIETIYFTSAEEALTDLLPFPEQLLDRQSDSAVQYLGQKIPLMSEQINQTTALALQNELREGFIQGEGVAQLGRRIDGVYDNATTWRSRTIARTEVIAASNAGALDGYAQTGLNPEKEWLAALDERTREDHIRADGQRVPLNSTFSVGGAQMQYPGDPAGGAAQTVNCRCTIIPVVRER